MRGVKDNIQEIASGLDWLTASSLTQDNASREFTGFMRYILAREHNQKADVKKLAFGEYSGQQVGGVQALFRARDGHQMLRFFGETTPWYASELMASGVPFKPTRIDGQITARFKEPREKYGRTCQNRVERHDKAQGKKTHTPIDAYTRMKGDSGITIGSRTSAVYTRIYDWQLKHQKETDQRIWRFEVELKEEAAMNFWHSYRASSEPDKLCAEMVATRLKKLGIDETGFGKLEPRAIAGTKKATEDELKLKHFETAIIPFICKLSDRGNRAKMMELALKYGLIDSSGVFLPETNEGQRK
jgi:hypothetical protein